MRLPVRKGEKYALVALDAGVAFDSVIELSDGLCALPPHAFELPDHWRDWLGTIKTGEIERAGLTLFVSAPAREPDVLDGDNQRLLKKVGFFYAGLLLAGRLRVTGPGTQLTGANRDGAVDVRQVGTLDPVVNITGLLLDRVTDGHVERAAAIAAGLERLFSDPRMTRMRMAASAFVNAVGLSDLGERIHQFVRVIDGLTRVRRRGRDRFRQRCATFVEEPHLQACFEMYVIRSNVEHFHDPGADLDPLPPREDVLRGYMRAIQAEALARHCLSHLLLTDSLWQQFSDEAVESFWTQEAQERAETWGAKYDLAEALKHFSAERVAY